MKEVTEQDLLNLKSKIENSKTKSAELTGSQKHLMKELKGDWNCDSVKEADKKIEEIGKEIDQLDKSIQKGINDLKTKYNFEDESTITKNQPRAEEGAAKRD